MAQLAANKLHIWDIFTCGKKCVLTEHVTQILGDERKTINFTAVLWTSEGGLFVLDALSTVYMVCDFIQGSKN